MDSHLSYESFCRSSPHERDALCLELASYLSRHVVVDSFHASIYGLIDELRRLGHDLWSFDESDDSQTWYRADRTPPAARAIYRVS